MASDCDSSPNALRVLVFHDSMILAMRDYLANSFRHVRFVWLMPPSLEDIGNYISVEHPDIVIEERVERRLNEIPVPPPVAETTLSTSAPPTNRGGWIDAIQTDNDEIIVDGWARWQSEGQQRKVILNTNLPISDMTLTEYARVDVSVEAHDDRLLRSGFRLRIKADPSRPRPDRIRLCVWTDDPVFGSLRLNYRNHQDWDTCTAS
jgi:hypothetical protein